MKLITNKTLALLLAASMATSNTFTMDTSYWNRFAGFATLAFNTCRTAWDNATLENAKLVYQTTKETLEAHPYASGGTVAAALIAGGSYAVYKLREATKEKARYENYVKNLAAEKAAKAREEDKTAQASSDSSTSSSSSTSSQKSVGEMTDEEYLAYKDQQEKALAELLSDDADEEKAENLHVSPLDMPIMKANPTRSTLLEMLNKDMQALDVHVNMNPELLHLTFIFSCRFAKVEVPENDDALCIKVRELQKRFKNAYDNAMKTYNMDDAEIIAAEIINLLK